MTEERFSKDLLTIASEICRELKTGMADFSSGMESRLVEDLAIDSLSRVELIQRIEKRFSVRLKDEEVFKAKSLSDIWLLLQTAAPSSNWTTLAPIANQQEVGTSQQIDNFNPLTLLELLDTRAKSTPNKVHIWLYGESDSEPEQITFSELKQVSTRKAFSLLAMGAEPGDRIALMLPTSRDFLECFFAILRAGCVPVPLYPPHNPALIEEHTRRQVNILKNAGATFLITVKEAKNFSRILLSLVPTLRDVLVAGEIEESQAPGALPKILPGDLAFLQYTSGSTGTPKGVMLTHANLIANIRCMGLATGIGPEDCVVSWLPLYHDMGLIGAWLGSLYHGLSMALMSPLAFLLRPERWLQAIHRHKATISGGPNFAYQLCVHKLTPDKIQGLDLSSWRLAFNGAEPVSAKTLQRFSDHFAPFGFRRESLCPVYGLAENSVGLSFTPYGRGPRVEQIDRETLQTQGIAKFLPLESAQSMEVVSSGIVIPEHQLRIVDTQGNTLAEGQEGEIEFCGPSATAGYFKNAQASAALYHDQWLKSGDRGFLANQEVFVTGRIKDIIIKAGRNIYPQQIEEVVGAVQGVRKGCVAVFAAQDSTHASEKLVVLAETRITSAFDLEKLKSEIQKAVSSICDVVPDDIVLAPAHSVLKTSSGKIQRSACREYYEQGKAGKSSTPFSQMSRLWTRSLPVRVWRFAKQVFEVVRGIWCWLLYLGPGTLVGIAMACLKTVYQRRVLGKYLSLSLIKLPGFSFEVEGLENVPKDGNFIYAINHCSYIDVIVVAAALPPHVAFVSKREMANTPILGSLLRLLGTKFVERANSEESVGQTDELVQATASGEHLVVFPEGTFFKPPGLRPFKLGVFSIAARANTPIVPVAISGTRKLLPDGRWLPRGAKLKVSVGTPIQPTGSEWSHILELRDKTRAYILQHCGELDLISNDTETEITPTSVLPSNIPTATI